MPDEKAINSRMDNTGKIVKKSIVYIINALLCSIAVTLATLPAVLYSYNSVFMTSIFINCIVIPLILYRLSLRILRLVQVIMFLISMTLCANVIQGWDSSE